MNRCKWLGLPLSLFAAGHVSAQDVRVIAEPARAQDASSGASPFNGLSDLPADVDFTLEPLYPARNNQARARIELLYSCVPESGGGRIVPCFITLDEPVARENSGGHHAGHLDGRPTGRHSSVSGWVDETDGYFRSTYSASEIGGVVDVTIHCNTWVGACRDGKVTFGVAVQDLEHIGVGAGYWLEGAKPPHPSNHWGHPNFVAALRALAASYRNAYPDAPDLHFNDISLEYGGIFDVATPTETGYDWTVPHREHRVGRNLDMDFPVGRERRAYVRQLFAMHNIAIGVVHADHWHLRY